MNDTKRVCVIGDGGWGTALAIVMHDHGHDVTVWGPFPDYIEQVRTARENARFLAGVSLPESIRWTAEHVEAATRSDIAILAVPTKYYRDVVSSFAGLFPAGCRFVSVAKGLDADTGMGMSQVAAGLLGVDEVCALSGPSHAEEVARHVPTAVTLAAHNLDTATELQRDFATPRFRVYTSTDIRGTELGGALKNIIAIAVGVSDGLGFGDNTRAALVTRGLAEITRLGRALGAQPETFAGLSGMGDLIVTCTSGLSRNRSVGERLGRGETVDEILGSMQQAAEGVWNCAAAWRLARELDVEVPITEQVYGMIHEGKPPADAVRDLLSRDFKGE